MRAAPVCAIAVLLLAAGASAEESARADQVQLAVPEVPPSMDRDAREELEEALASVRTIGPLVRLGGTPRAPCGIVFRGGGLVRARASLSWRAGRLVERVQWEVVPHGEPMWSRTRWVRIEAGPELLRGRVMRELHSSMQYRGGHADCPGSSRRVYARDASGRIVSVRSTVETCEGVDAGTWRYRHVWRHRAGYEEAIVHARHEADRAASVSVRRLVPDEREAWAALGGEGPFPRWLDVRDTDGFLRVRLESPDEVGSYAYECAGPEWPHGPTAPEVIDPRALALDAR